ncbi:hypothetical protein [Hephaestia mangrovi]|uniref:hypothetical protein n=1 Tax=Hephaestia mangrovi TaxID=2873268 RepID=UPI001CA6F772|nr:hypothetical protein [Hephaestia mangrovi]MBY8829159.1 hypothetical protein [Hephaestia mangrovi]
MFNKYRHIVEARKSLGSDVASAFLPAEAAIITAAAQLSVCSGTLIERHSAASLKPSTGTSVIDLVAESARLAIASRAKMLEAHEQLSKLTEELGFIEYVPECPPNEAALQEPLRVVA